MCSRWRLTASLDRSYWRVKARLDWPSMTNASLIRTLSGWLQTVQLRDTETPYRNVLYLTHQPTSSPDAHGHTEHEVIILGEPPAFEIVDGIRLGLEVLKLLGERAGEIEGLGYLELLLLEEEEGCGYQIAPRHEVARVRAVGDTPRDPCNGDRAKSYLVLRIS